MGAFSPQQRLVIAIDLKPNRALPPKARILDLWKQAIEAIQRYANLGVTLKFNSAARAFGYEICEAAKAYGVEVFLDFKLIDIEETLRIDGMIQDGIMPRFTTCMAQNSRQALSGLKAELMDSSVIAVTILTSLNERDCLDIYNSKPNKGQTAIEYETLKFARRAKEAGLDGVVSSAKDAPALRNLLGAEFLLIGAGIRPKALLVPGDDQNQDRVMTPAKAGAAGTDIFVVGRPITGDTNPRDAAQMVLEEISTIG